MANTTWSGTDKTANVTLSGTNNVIATSNNVGFGGVRALDRQATGKFYWEVTPTVLAGTSAVGVATQLMTLNTGPLTVPGQVGGFTLNSAGTAFINASSLSFSGFGVFVVSTVICIALDLTDQLIWIRNGAAANWNASATANPATLSGGIDLRGPGLSDPQVPLYPMLLFQNANTTSFTANFGDSAFSGTVPSGFTSGFTSGASVPTSAIDSGLVRETLYVQANSQIHASGLVREVLRTTGTGGATFIAADGLVREVLRTTSSVAGGPFISLIM